MRLRRPPFQDVRLRRLRMKSLRVQPLNLNERPSQKRARSIITTEAAIAWSPHWGLFTALTVGVFVFLLLMPIPSDTAGIANEARLLRRTLPSCRSFCASNFAIGQSTLGLEGFSYGCKHLKYALTAPGTHRCNGDWPYGRSSQCRR